MGQEKYQGLVESGKGHFNGVVKCHPDALSIPIKRRKPTIWFVNSMSDLFHKGVPLKFIQEVFSVMEQCPQHTFQVLTKRPERAAELSGSLPWPANVWLGTSIEDSRVMGRLDHLLNTPAKVKYLGLEPLIGPLDGLDVSGVQWVIAGGESGSGARPMDAEWVRDIRDKCVASGVPFFFKQWGKVANNPDPSDPTIKSKESKSGSKGGRLLDGEVWQQMPGGVRKAA